MPGTFDMRAAYSPERNRVIAVLHVSEDAQPFMDKGCEIHDIGPGGKRVTSSLRLVEWFDEPVQS